MREIGGYIELDTYHLPMLHDKAVALNCGRNALAYILKAREIRKLWLPKLICKSIVDICERENVSYSFYNIDRNFHPVQTISLETNEYLYIINYYSFLDNYWIKQCVDKYTNIIIDNAQSYYQMPVPGVDTIYSCRKYFGVADGAFLYTDTTLQDALPIDESHERMHYLLGRYERTASEYYAEYIDNNSHFTDEPIKKMSKLTHNLLHGIDYKHVLSIRNKNFQILNDAFMPVNLLNIPETKGSFMYPLLIENGHDIRKYLQRRNIYIPVLWPYVLSSCNPDETEYILANDILPLPIDQRYDQSDMNYIISEILSILSK